MKQRNKKHTFKNAAAGFVLRLLSKGLQAASIKDSEVKKISSAMPEGYWIRFEVAPEELGITSGIKVIGGQFFRNKEEGDADIVITFKNIQAAWPVLTGAMSIQDAYNENRFIMRGDYTVVMKLLDAVNIVENYLFPSFITKKILTKPYRKEVGSLSMYASILFRR